jgi:hypothetical protein
MVQMLLAIDEVVVAVAGAVAVALAVIGVFLVRPALKIGFGEARLSGPSPEFLCASLAFERWLAFLDERAHAFLLVFRGEEHVEQFALVLRALLQ